MKISVTSRVFDLSCEISYSEGVCGIVTHSIVAVLRSADRVYIAYSFTSVSIGVA